MTDQRDQVEQEEQIEQGKIEQGNQRDQVDNGDQVEQDDKKEKIGYGNILKQTEYMKVIVANLISRFGDSIDAIAFTWLVYAITGSAAWSAIIFAVNQLPSVLVQPFAGALVENMDKKKIMVITDFIRGGIVVGLAVLYLTGNVNAWILLLFTIINSCVEAFCLPASMAVIPKIIDKKYYTFGTSLSSTLSTVIQLVGIGAAGLIIGMFGVGVAIFIDGVSFFGSAFILCFLKIKETNLRAGRPEVKEYLRNLSGGVKYLKKQPVIRNFCILGVVINAAVTPLSALQSPMISEIMGQGGELLSVFSMALMAGMGIGAFLYPFYSKHLNARANIVLGGLGVGVGFYSYTVGSYLQESILAIYALTIGASVLVGFAANMVNAALSVQFMKHVEQDYLARVGSIFNAGACAATPVVSSVIGIFTAFCPVVQIFRICAIVCVIIFIFVVVRRVQFE